MCINALQEVVSHQAELHERVQEAEERVAALELEAAARLGLYEVADQVHVARGAACRDAAAAAPMANRVCNGQEGGACQHAARQQAARQRAARRARRAARMFAAVAELRGWTKAGGGITFSGAILAALYATLLRYGTGGLFLQAVGSGVALNLLVFFLWDVRRPSPARLPTSRTACSACVTII